MISPLSSAPREQKPLWKWASILVALTTTVHVYVLWSCRYLPLVDLPNHMARHSLESIHLVGGELPPFYEITYRVLPNLAGDLTIPGLVLIFNQDTASKVFLALAWLLYWLGPACFIWSQARDRRSGVLACMLWLPFGLSSQLFWGFLNYYAAFGLAFLTLAHFVRLQHQRGGSPVGLAVHALLVALLFLGHLAAWGVYGVIMGCLLLATLRRIYHEQGLAPCLRRMLVSLLPVVPSLILFGVYVLHRPSMADASEYNWGGWLRKLTLPVTLFRTYSWAADGLSACLWIAALIAGFGFGTLRGKRQGALVLCLAVLGLLYLVLPYQLGSTSDTDSRLLPAMLVCVLAWLGSRPARGYRVALLLLAACILIRYASVAVAWQRLSERLESHTPAFALLEPRSRVLSIVLAPDSKEYPERHFLAWAVASREIFVPTLFAHADQQPLAFREPFRSCAKSAMREGELHLPTVRACFDYLWIYNPENQPIELPASFERLYAENGLTVLKIK